MCFVYILFFIRSIQFARLAFHVFRFGESVKVRLRLSTKLEPKSSWPELRGHPIKLVLKRILSNFFGQSFVLRCKRDFQDTRKFFQPCKACVCSWLSLYKCSAIEMMFAARMVSMSVARNSLLPIVCVKTVMAFIFIHILF